MELPFFSPSLDLDLVPRVVFFSLSCVLHPQQVSLRQRQQWVASRSSWLAPNSMSISELFLFGGNQLQVTIPNPGKTWLVWWSRVHPFLVLSRNRIATCQVWSSRSPLPVLPTRGHAWDGMGIKCPRVDARWPAGADDEATYPGEWHRA